MMTWRSAHKSLLVACVLCGCSGTDPDVRPVHTDTLPSAQPVEALAPATAPPAPMSTAPQAAAFVAAAESVVAFLRGDAAFSALRLSDTVTFYLAPQSGGGRARTAAADLRDRRTWRIRSAGLGHDYSLVPPAHLSGLKTAFGRHIRCFEYDLADEFPQLARLPHVGTRLEPDDMSSCLQTWNLTFVFRADTMPPVLAAVIYDQWEW